MSRNGADSWTWVLGIFGIGNLANGLWMLLDAPGWYVNLPAAVPDFGPLNEHFVRDIGAAYVTIGVALVAGAFRLALRLFAVGLATVFTALHALGHVSDTALGRVGPEHWWIDFPGIYLPLILLGGVWLALARSGAR